jgi:hypothetical protein
MAEKKLTETQLRNQVVALLNQAAKETDIKKAASLRAQAKVLNEQVKALKKKSSATQNLSVVQKAQTELNRLSKLDPNTPGIAPLKAAQEKIIADATKKGLPPTEGTPSVIAAPGPLGNFQMSTGTTAAPATKPTTGGTRGRTTGGTRGRTAGGTGTGSSNVANTSAFPQYSGVDTTTLAGITAASGRPVTPSLTPTAKAENDINAIFNLAKSKFAQVDSIFLFDDELRQLLIDAVKDPATAEDDMKPEEFLRRLNASEWMVRNASTYSRRDAQRRQYNELLSKYESQLAVADTQTKKDALSKKIGELKTNSAYARGLAEARASIERTAGGLIGTLTPDQLDSLVKRMYDSANENDPNIIKKELSYLLNYKPGTTLGGEAGVDLTELRKTAAANGFDLDKDFGSSITTWLQRLAVGDSVETFKNVIRSQAKLGLPDKVASLLDQGMDLEGIYAPYRKLMAATLEVTPDSIKLNDPTLRSAIGPDKETSLYDFQRQLRKDARWQYTNNAREEVSNSALKVLQDFGFQG